MNFDKTLHGIVGYRDSAAGQAYAGAIGERKAAGEQHLNATGMTVSQTRTMDAPGL